MTPKVLPAAAARQKRGLSLEAAAKRLRITPRTLSEYEAGRGKNFYRAQKIARFYGCSPFGCFTEQGIANMQAE